MCWGSHTENTPDKLVLVFSEGLEYGYNKRACTKVWRRSPRRASMCSSTKVQKRRFRRSRAAESEDDFHRTIEENAVSGSGEEIAALDVSLDQWRISHRGKPGLRERHSELYGFGSTTKILNQMDRGG